MLTPNCIILTALIIAGIEDIRTREIHTCIFLLAYLALAIVNANIFYFIIPSCLALFFTGDNQLFGGADIDAVLLIGLSGNFTYTVYAIIAACIYALIVSIFLENKEEIPYVACLGMGFLTILI